jgi:hypothetical protein
MALQIQIRAALASKRLSLSGVGTTNPSSTVIDTAVLEVGGICFLAPETNAWSEERVHWKCYTRTYQFRLLLRDFSIETAKLFVSPLNNPAQFTPLYLYLEHDIRPTAALNLLHVEDLSRQLRHPPHRDR